MFCIDISLRYEHLNVYDQAFALVRCNQCSELTILCYSTHWMCSVTRYQIETTRNVSTWITYPEG